MSWLKLANKTAVVTGAGSGIGAAVAKALSMEECRVVLVDRDEDKLHRTAEQCSSATTVGSSSSLQIAACDVSNESQVQNLFQTHGASSSILINCAGITRDGWIGKMSVDQWDQVQDVNLKGTFLCCREFLEALKEQQQQQQISTTDSLSASIVNVSSIVAIKGNLGQVNYAASKGGVIGLTKALAKEVAYRQVRVNCVLPGFIDTEMTQAVPEPVRDSMKTRIPFGRFGQPEDIANLILFLASCERSGYITGEAIECSGFISL